MFSDKVVAISYFFAPYRKRTALNVKRCQLELDIALEPFKLGKRVLICACKWRLEINENTPRTNTNIPVLVHQCEGYLQFSNHSVSFEQSNPRVSKNCSQGLQRIREDNATILAWQFFYLQIMVTESAKLFPASQYTSSLRSHPMNANLGDLSVPTVDSNITSYFDANVTWKETCKDEKQYFAVHIQLYSDKSGTSTKSSCQTF